MSSMFIGNQRRSCKSYFLCRSHPLYCDQKLISWYGANNDHSVSPGMFQSSSEPRLYFIALQLSDQSIGGIFSNWCAIAFMGNGVSKEMPISTPSRNGIGKFMDFPETMSGTGMPAFTNLPMELRAKMPGMPRN